MKTYASNFLFIGFFALVVSPLGSLSSEEQATCKRCQLIREENAKKGPPEFKYYDDYLRAEEAKKGAQEKEPLAPEDIKQTDRP